MSTPSADGYVWRPDDHPWTRESHLARFLRQHGFHTLTELREASVRDPVWFWDVAMRDLKLEWRQRYTKVRDDSAGFPWTRWFVGGQINIAHNCLYRHVRDGHGGETALFYEGEGGIPGRQRSVTYRELADLVTRCATAMRAAGVRRGDSVALYAPMQVPTVVVMLAAMKLGARFVPIFCGYGEEALRERLQLC
jgi:acetyl-CoA synthetase